MKKRFLAILLCLCMVVGFLPTIELAADAGEETTAYVRISSMDELTTGQYVLVNSAGYAPLVFEGVESGKNWIAAAEPQIAGNTVTDTAGAVWTITVDGSSATLTDNNGVSIAPKSGGTNGIQSGNYRWAVACADGTFTFSGTGDDTTILASNLSKENKLRAYKTDTVSSYPGYYLSTFTLYKLDVVSGGETGGETGGEAGGETGGETEVKTYTVTFDANGGTVTPTSAETDADGKLSELPTPTRVGYVFAGWFAAAAGGEQMTIDTVFTADTTVYAHWTLRSGEAGEEPVNDFKTDADTVQAIVQWSGTGSYDATANASQIHGDRYISGDQKDTGAVFSVVAGGTAVQPYIFVKVNDTKSNLYMGGVNIGTSSGDHMQFAVNTAGWADMVLSFRLRATNTAPGAFQLYYSTDNGSTWWNFTTGSYAYSYTKYTVEGEEEVSASGDITDGAARPSLARTYYVSFSFDVPGGAENCENLLIRLVPGTERADGDTTKPISGNVRIDSVALTGSPIADESIAACVKVTRDETELTMTSKAGAVIYYRVDGGEWQTYHADSKPTLTALPCDIEAYAAVDGKHDSPVLLYHYDGHIVTFDANGGTVAPTAKVTDAEGKLQELPTPTRANYTFVGWFTAAEDGEQVTADTVFTEDTTVYVQWVSAEHTGGTADCTHKAVCTVCGEEYGEIDASHHAAFKHVEAKAATTDADGNIEYWYCESCGRYFSDADGKNEIQLADTVLAKLDKSEDKDDDKTSPETGDHTNLTPWIVLLFVSSLAILGIAVCGKKKKYYFE